MKKEVKILGIPLYKKIKENNRKKIYLLGIKVYEKVLLESYTEKIVTEKINKYLSVFLSDFCDIHEIKSKAGKLKFLNDGNTELLRIFDEICQKHNLTYWLMYGTLLGAVRHKGYIPWDYDADIGMLREDYNKLYEILEKELENTCIEVYGISKIMPQYGNVIVLRNKFGNQFLNLDVIPYDRYFKKIDNDDEHAELYNKLIKGKKYFYEVFPIDKYLTSKEEIQCINAKLQKYTDQVICESQKYEDKPYIFKGLMTSPDKFFNVFYAWEDLFPVKRAEYENIMVNIPNNSHKILADFYGDYNNYPNEFCIEHLAFLSKFIPDNAENIVEDLRKINILEKGKV